MMGEIKVKKRKLIEIPLKSHFFIQCILNRRRRCILFSEYGKSINFNTTYMDNLEVPQNDLINLLENEFKNLLEIEHKGNIITPLELYTLIRDFIINNKNKLDYDEVSLINFIYENGMVIHKDRVGNIFAVYDLYFKRKKLS